ncbi:head-tail connector protein [Oceanobacillus profundus]|uniref:head-tail connector protein n=1 Tax=Oceanobacillus profundus TaxID=372463 RepID=UPI00203FC9A6|nr:head-tail connector protein [Oceanobacillus profundus]MCM3396788.1 head-tail connector protein [Oceanobacillus profundus]
MLSLVKQFLRLDDHYKHEDELLNHLIETAKEYLKNATGQEFNEEINIHKQIVILLVTSWYENRNTQIAQELDRTLTSMLLQAGLIGDV